MSGWIKLHRKIKKHRLYLEKRAFSNFEAFASLLLDAAWDEKTVCIRGRDIRLQRGELCHSMRFFGDHWGWGPSKVKRFFADLERGGEITKKTEGGMSIISVSNYAEYQGGEDDQNTQKETTGDYLRTNNRTNNRTDFGTETGPILEQKKESLTVDAAASCEGDQTGTGPILEQKPDRFWNRNRTDFGTELKKLRNQETTTPPLTPPPKGGDEVRNFSSTGMSAAERLEMRMSPEHERILEIWKSERKKRGLSQLIDDSARSGADCLAENLKRGVTEDEIRGAISVILADPERRTKWGLPGIARRLASLIDESEAKRAPVARRERAEPEIQPMTPEELREGLREAEKQLADAEGGGNSMRAGFIRARIAQTRRAIAEAEKKKIMKKNVDK